MLYRTICSTPFPCWLSNVDIKAAIFLSAYTELNYRSALKREKKVDFGLSTDDVTATTDRDAASEAGF
jgi:proteasome lid subunit RPN8/RPN11